MKVATLNERTRCYERQEVLSLPNGKGAMPLATIGLAECPDGWRFSTGFYFTTGNHWGSGGPIYAAYPVFPTREAAIEAAATKLCAEIAGVDEAMQPQRRQIEAWARGLGQGRLL